MSLFRRPSALAALAVALVAGLLALGLWLGGHPKDLPGFLRNAFVAGGQGDAVQEALETISHDYYRQVKPQALTSASIDGLVASLHDPYSTYLPPSEFKSFDAPQTFTGIGVSIVPSRAGLRIMTVFDDSPASRAGLRAGEEIVSADGHRLHGASIAKAVSLIEGAPGTQVHLGMSRGGRPRRVTITRETISRPIVASEMRTQKGVKIGWVYLASFSEGAHAQLAEAVHSLLKQGAKGLVLDLRANGGGLVSEAELVASLFLRQGKAIVTTKGRAQPTVVLRAVGGSIPASVPMAVLVDGETASAAEIVTAALQDDGRAKVVGTHTFGKGVFQELEPLANGGGLKITVGEYFTPDGRNLGGGGVHEGKGITPEVTVPKGTVDSERGLQIALRTVAAKVETSKGPQIAPHTVTAKVR
jgi:carboxyl-terminal processing protease